MREGGISYGITKDDPPRPPRPATKRKPITLIKARFSSKCAGCGEDIHEDDLLAAVDDGFGGTEWVCENCGEES